MLKIVLTHPFCWPYVRRGSERFIAELAAFLTRRGHEIITISTKPGRGQQESTEHGRRILCNQLWLPAMAKVRVTPSHTFTLGLGKALLGIRADVVHSLAYFDACVANLLRRHKCYRTVYQVTGPPVPYWLPRVPPDRYAVGSAVRKSDRLVAHSDFTANIVHEHYGRRPAVVPVPIDLTQFPLKNGSAPQRPTLLCVASFDERRKGLRVLLEAFKIVKQSQPDALLRLCGKMTPQLQHETIDALPEHVRRDVEVLGVGQLSDVPKAYREASVTILPSMWEAYGMVVVESWASGTPVVVTRHGGLPELIRDDALGRTFDPQTDGQETANAAGLATAILDALPLSLDDATRTACRARAEGFTWDSLGPIYEAMYTD